MRINQSALELVKEFEGPRLSAYQDSVGVWTIGYCTTAAAGLGITPRAGMTITAAEAETYLLRGLEKFAAQIEQGITVAVNDKQFGALVSLAYNIGPGAFLKSTLLRTLYAGDFVGVADKFAVWNKAGGKVLAGLTWRRAAERALFENPVPVNPAGGGGLIAAILSFLAKLFGGAK